MIISYILIFIFGLITGSFLNCVICRLFSGDNPFKGRSFCPHCHHQLSWQDLIPLFSFMVLKARCRYCHQKISWQYPLVELSTAILFVLTFHQIHYSLSLFYYFLIISFLIVIFVYDLKHYIISDKIIFPAIAVSFIFQIFRSSNLNAFLNPLLSAVLPALFFFSIVLISKGRGMGVGDVKLVFFIGLFLGFPNIIPALFLSFFTGALVGVILIITGKKGLKSEVPFGPFLTGYTNNNREKRTKIRGSFWSFFNRLNHFSLSF